MHVSCISFYFCSTPATSRTRMYSMGPPVEHPYISRMIWVCASACFCLDGTRHYARSELHVTKPGRTELCSKEAWCSGSVSMRGVTPGGHHLVSIHQYTGMCFSPASGWTLNVCQPGCACLWCCVSELAHVLALV